MALFRKRRPKMTEDNPLLGPIVFMPLVVILIGALAFMIYLAVS